MTVKCLTQTQKDIIAYAYQHKRYTQKELAILYKVSERTINRILEEHGLASPVPRLKGEAYQAMQVLKRHNLTVEQLDAALSRPVLSFESVQQYLNTCSREQLAKLFYNSSLIKIAELLSQAKQKEKEAAHAETP